jgi:hypothetical protein
VASLRVVACATLNITAVPATALAPTGANVSALNANSIKAAADLTLHLVRLAAELQVFEQLRCVAAVMFVDWLPVTNSASFEF